MIFNAEEYDKRSNNPFIVQLTATLVKCSSGGNNTEDNTWQKMVSNGVQCKLDSVVIKLEIYGFH